MNILKIIPKNLKGNISIPSSKSMGHREIICAALGNGESLVDNISISKDIDATCNSLRNLGVEIEEVKSKIDGRKAFKIMGKDGKFQVKNKIIDCGESGSTLRFLIPFGAICGKEVIFEGHGKLVSRPLNAYYDIFDEKGISYETAENGNLPLKINGELKAGEYKLPGDVSSQFITGLLFILPLLKGNSNLKITSKLESRSYVDLTLSCLKKYGIKVEHDNYMNYRISGNQHYSNNKISYVEGDYSQIAFWLVAGALNENENNIKCQGMDLNSLQGDKIVLEILKKMGVKLKIDEAKNEIEVFGGEKTKSTVIDASDCPDIIPVLTVLASLSEGTTEIKNAGRLRIKECDRLQAITTELNKIGADVKELPEGLIINGKKNLIGGEVECWNDHRIAMSMAVASIKCKEPLILKGTESVAKSYPEFWNDFANLGGKYE
ncbi:3-phosphoshikimate 1-carboxyvinyltransferase [Fusobacterium sp. MFO224]|uniref:3-phosphoshikimate 1-carboxyvinyltransferase n=1 Tax=Fusobacterium sp. MFO224 TaxID=3378070 RepID=UPI0038550817